MARRKKLIKVLLGILTGIFLSQIFTTTKLMQDMCLMQTKQRASPMQLIAEENQRASNKSLLFVGVMTAAQYLDSRAKAVYETWGREVPGKVMFFSSEFSVSEHVPLVALPGVDDSYPPQKKSFMMLKYMYENHLDQYEWFVRADDDVYIRTDRLEQLLRSVDSKKPWFIGQTGRGRSEEFGLLSLDSDENFCMGGPGVIFSRETLRRVAPYVEDCLQELYTTHEDVELGRCVHRFAGISCTWSYEMQVIFYHNKSGQAAFTGNLKQKEVHHAINLHPIKQPQHMYRLHKYVKGLQVQNNQQESITLHRDIAASMQELNSHLDRLDVAMLDNNLPLFAEPKGSDKYLGDTRVLGIPTKLNRYTPHNLEDVLEWELIAKTLYSSKDLNPKKRIGSALKEGLADVVREIMELINSYSKQRGRIIDFKEILYGYWRLDPVHGVDLILDLLLTYRKYRGHKMTVQVRRHSYVQQTFSGIFIREVDYTSNNFQNLPPSSTELVPVHQKLVHKLYSKLNENLLVPIFNKLDNTQTPYIHFILPISGRFNILKRFLKLYETVCLKENERTRLFIILYKDSDDDYANSLNLIESIRTSNKVASSDMKLILPATGFSRGNALQFGVNAVESDELMFFIDVDMRFDKQTLERIRRNTIRNTSIYFPIVFSMYNPKLLNLTVDSLILEDSKTIINEESGFWRQFGFGIVSLYKSDYYNLGGFDLQISGWGNEDVVFYDNAIKSNLKIVRSTDPSLIHVYHSVECDEQLDVAQKNMCLGTKTSMLGSFNTLQRVFMKYKHLFR